MSRLHLFQSGFLEKHYEWISLRVFAFHRGQAVTMINNHKTAYCRRQNTNFEILVPSFPPLLVISVSVNEILRKLCIWAKVLDRTNFFFEV